MKRYLIFLLTLILLIGIKAEKVSAESFSENEYLDAYVRVEKGARKKWSRQRVFRRSDGKIAYCAEPLETFSAGSTYTIDSSRLSEQTFNRIGKIMMLGYGYNSNGYNHTDMKWYSATQMLIWREIDPSASYYFTDTLNGNVIPYVENEMNEIMSLVKRAETFPDLRGHDTGKVGETLVLEDINHVVSDFASDNPDIKIEGNTVKVYNIKEGSTYGNLWRYYENLGDIGATYFHTDNGQDMVQRGNIVPDGIGVTFHGIKNNINIIKHDTDSNNETPSGDAKIEGTVLGLYKYDGELLQEITLDKSSYTINDLMPGSYYIKEIKPGEGYTLNENKYDFMVQEDTKNLDVIIDNKVIEKEITIHKMTEDTKECEEGIEFEIKNSKGETVDKITTDKDGIAKTTLPYGKYTISQLNTKEGYEKVEDFEIDVNDIETDYDYNLYDEKTIIPETPKEEIKVPDSGIKEENSVYVLLSLLLLPILLLFKKKCIN